MLWIMIRITELNGMAQKNSKRKGLLVQALEDGLKKAVELSVVTVSVGYPPEIIFIASAAVFAGSFMFKAVNLKISERR